MSKGIVNTIIGGAEIAAGVALTVLTGGAGAAFGAALIVAGAGEVMTGVAMMLEKQPGQGVATTNPIGAYNYIYGTMKVPGVEIFSETNSITQTGAHTSNDKQWHRVFVLACHPTSDLLEVRLDGQVLNLIPQTSSVAHTKIWQSASPTQTTRSITSISRSGGIVTMHVSGGFSSSFNGQTMLVSGVADNTYNGPWVMWLPNPADTTTWEYCCGGADGSSSGGRCETCLPDYSNKVHVEFQDGNQTQTFPGLLEAQVGSTSPLTWTNTDVCYGHTLVYIQMGYDSSYFPSYPTNLSFVVKGKNDILDPRTSTRGYTTNSALCIADYLCQNRIRGGFGLSIGSTIDTTNLIAAANICDETLTLAVGGTVTQYSCNTNLSLNTSRGSNLQNMLSSCAGRLSVQGGIWSLLPGAFVAPSLFLNESHIMGPIQLNTRLSVTEACNAVKGTYINPANNYQPSDYPLYQVDSLHGYVTNIWLAEDNNEILVHNLDLPCTNISAVAQRLAKIQLMRQRYQYRLHLICDLTAYQASVGDVIALSIGRYSWVDEPFEVLHSGLLLDEGGKISVELDLAQLDGANSALNSAIYGWSPTEELSITDSIVPNNVGTRICVPPENVMAYSGPGAVINGITMPSTITTRADGTVQNSIYVRWTQPNDSNVVNGGHLEVQWQQVGASSWTAFGRFDPSVASCFISPVSDGVSYIVQVRAVNAANVPSAWISASSVTVGNSLSTTSYSGVALAQSALTAFATGSTATIDIASFTATVGSASVSCAPSTTALTGLNQGQLYYIYYVDATFAGGSITPIATQNTGDYLGRSGYFLIGQIMTPVSGSTGIYRPTAYVDDGDRTSTNPAYAYDGNPSSYAYLTAVNTTLDGPSQADVVWSGFASFTPTSSMTLTVTAGSGIPSGSLTGPCEITAWFGGSNHTIASISTTTSATAYTLTIPSGTNLSTITVEAFAAYPSSTGTLTVKIYIYDIKIQ